VSAFDAIDMLDDHDLGLFTQVRVRIRI